MLGVIILSHGSRDPDWGRPLEAVAAEVRRLSPGALVGCAYLELAEPNLAVCARHLIAQGVTELRILPVFFGMGRHARNDLPARVDALRQQHPDIHIDCLPTAGEHPDMIRLLASIALEGAAPP